MNDPNADIIGQIFTNPSDEHDYRVVGSEFGDGRYDPEWVTLEPFPSGGEYRAGLTSFVRLAIADSLHGQRTRAIGEVSP